MIQRVQTTRKKFAIQFSFYTNLNLGLLSGFLHHASLLFKVAFEFVYMSELASLLIILKFVNPQNREVVAKDSWNELDCKKYSLYPRLV